MNREWIEGKLCELGYLKEIYDEEKDELVRTITPKGIKEIRKMMKKQEWRDIALAMMIERGWTLEEIETFFKIFK